MITERNHHTSQTKTIPGIGEVIITVRDRLQCHDKIHPSRILNQPGSNSPNPSVFNRFGNQNQSNNISYEKKFPISNNGNQPNVVRFTTTGDEINRLS